MIVPRTMYTSSGVCSRYGCPFSRTPPSLLSSRVSISIETKRPIVSYPVGSKAVSLKQQSTQFEMKTTQRKPHKINGSVGFGFETKKELICVSGEAATRMSTNIITDCCRNGYQIDKYFLVSNKVTRIHLWQC